MPPLDPQLVHDVVQLDKEGMTWRAIARALHISRNTVRHIVTSHQAAREAAHSALPWARSSRRRVSKLEPFRRQIAELLERYPDITAQRVFEIPAQPPRSARRCRCPGPSAEGSSQPP